MTCTTHHHACDCREAEHAAEIARLMAALDTAALALRDAAISVIDWGTYASDYFQKKHGLASDIARIQAAHLAAIDAARSKT